MSELKTELPPGEIEELSSGQKTKVGRNVVWNLAGSSWSVLITLVTTPLILHRMGADAYGILITLNVVVNNVAFLDLGLGQATIREVAEAADEGDWTTVSRVFWTSAISYGILGIFASLLMWFAAPSLVGSWLRVPETLQPETLLAFRISSAGLFLSMLTYGPMSLLRGLERFDHVNRINITIATAQPLLTVGLLIAGFGLPVIVTSGVLLTAFSLAASGLIGWRTSTWRGRPSWHQATFLRLLKFGGMITISSMIVPVLLNLEKFLLANRVSMSAVAFYMIPHNIAARIGIIPSSFSNALYPNFSALNGRGEIEQAATLNANATQTILSLTLPLVIVPVVLAPELLELWMGADFAAESTVAARILLIAALLHTVAWTPHMLIQALGRPDITLKVYVVQLLIMAGVTYVCVDRWGIEGAAVAWLLRCLLDSALVWVAGGRLTNTHRSFVHTLVDARFAVMLTAAGLGWWAKGLYYSGGPWLGLSLGVLCIGLLAGASLSAYRRARRTIFHRPALSQQKLT